jgi:hypothetical protein
MQDTKKVNVKIMERINDEQLEKLIGSKNIDGFDFFVEKVNLAVDMGTTHT